MIKYRLQLRKCATNAIERKLPGNKHWEVFIMGSHPKKEVDLVIDKILKELNKPVPRAD